MKIYLLYLGTLDHLPVDEIHNRKALFTDSILPTVTQMYICLKLPKFKGIKILRFISVAINLEKRIHKFRLIEWEKKYKYSRKYVFDELYLGF